MSQFLPTDLEYYSPILGRFYWHLRMNQASRSDARAWLFVVLHHEGPLTLPSLLSATKTLMHKASVYRILDLFVLIGVAEEVRPGLYDLTDRFKQHGHGLWCRVCGRRAGFWDEQLEKRLGWLAQKRNFALEEHQVELVGICPKCLLDSTNQQREPIGLKLRRLPAGGYRTAD